MNATEGRNYTNAIWSWGAGDATASDDDDDENNPMQFQALPSAVEDQGEEDTPPDPPAMTQSSSSSTSPTLTSRKTKNASQHSPFKFSGSSFSSRKKHHLEFEDEGPVTPGTFLLKIMPSPIIRARDTLTRTQKKKKEGSMRRSQRQLSIRTSIRFLDCRSLSSNEINDCADPAIQKEDSSATISTNNTDIPSPPAETQDAETQDPNKEPLPEEEKVAKAKKSNRSIKEKKEKKEKDKKNSRKPDPKTVKKEKKSKSKKTSSKEKSKTRRGSSDS
jgi:hypothetical protein